MRKHIFKLRVLFLLGLFNLLFIAQSKLFAQGDFGCGDEDPTEDCPIDTWINVLVVFMILFAIYNCWKKSRALNFMV